MKTPFNIVDDILFTKDSERLTPSDDCNLFVINKLVSYHSPVYCNILNQTVNQYKNTLNDQQTVDFLRLVFPKTNKRRIEWLYKKNKAVEKNETIVTQLARSLEFSKRDIQEAVSLFPEILDEFDDEEKMYKKVEK